VRAFAASVATFWIWDDHEVRNNWFPGEVLNARVLERSADAGVPRTEARLDVLAVHARRAMIEHWPTLLPAAAPGVMYRSVPWGPLLEVFYVDGRSYRTANHPVPSAEAYFGATQLAWLEGALVRSKATWKVIACNMPVALVISEPAPDGSGVDAFDAFANDSASISGRELELAHLFATLRARDVHNVVWLTADVHYAAAHRFDPSRAAFKDLDPFWEFVAGPMHASSFPRKRFDDTFGPELAYASAGWDSFGSPASGEQYFGVVRIDGRTEVMTVTLVDAAGHDLHETVLRPHR
jgi:alkaline phosphatase D